MANTTSTTHISSKGQVIIPKALRDAKRWPAGTALVAEQTDEGILLRPASAQHKQDASATLRSIQERIGYQGKAVSAAEMKQAIADEAERRGRR